MKSLCMRTTELVEDTDIGCGVLTDGSKSDQLARVDLSGIDLLADAILAGAEGWARIKYANELISACWVGAFLNLVDTLKR